MVKKKPEDIVAVVSSSLKSYYYFFRLLGTGMDSLQKAFKAIPIVLDSEYVGKNFTFRVEDKAIMLIFGHVNTDTDHNIYLQRIISMLKPTGHFALVTLFNINRLAVSN